MTDENQEDEWKKYNEDPSVKLYTMHPGASCFKAPEPDPECPSLFKDKKELEKKHLMLHNMTGAAGHLVAETLVSCQLEIQNLADTIKDYADLNVEIDDPRKDAKEIFEALKGKNLLKIIKL